MPKVQSISKSNFAWNSLQKEHHIAHVAVMLRRNNTLNKGGGVSKKWHPFYGGVSEKWPWVTWGEGGSKISKKGGTSFVNGPSTWILNKIWYALINMVQIDDNGNHCHNIQGTLQDNIHHLIQEHNEFPQDSTFLYAISVFHFHLLPAFLPFYELFHFQEFSNHHVFCTQGPR